jgi:hypothetical protein
VTFNDAAVSTVFDKIVSHAMESGRFDNVNEHEPKSSPGTGTLCSVWIQQVRPYRLSGMGAISGVVILNARIYMNFRQKPYDMIDQNITSASMDLMAAMAGDFDFGGDAGVRAVDLMGASGFPLSCQSGYVEIDRQMFRVMTVTIPVIVNDMFDVTSGGLDANYQAVGTW